MFNLAVRGFLIGGILLTAGVSFSADGTQKPADEAKPSQKAAQNKETTQPLFVLEEKQASPTQNKTADYKADYYAEADLNAQERMAAEAKHLAELTYTQIWISSAEAVFVFLTAIFAAIAAIAASQAARAAHLTIDFMRKAERPFFVVSKITPSLFEKAIASFRSLRDKRSKDDRYSVGIIVSINNAGTRPGIIRSVHFDYCWQPPPEKQPEIETLGEWAGKQSIAPENTSPNIFGAFVFKADFINGFIELGERLCVHGFVRYSDMHGTTWRSGFSFEYGPPIGSGYEGTFVRSSPTSYWYDIEENNQDEQPHSWWGRILGLFAT